jgi:hypothetical protein
MAQFRVVLDEVELDERQHRALDRALQKTTLQFLADHDSGGDRAAYYIPKILRPPLAGIWIRKFDEQFAKKFNADAGLQESMRKLNAELEQGGGF